MPGLEFGTQWHKLIASYTEKTRLKLDREVGGGCFFLCDDHDDHAHDHRDHHQFHENFKPLWWNRKFSSLSRHATHNKSSDGVQIIMIMLMIIVIIINFMKISYPYGGTVNFQICLDMPRWIHVRTHVRTKLQETIRRAQKE